MADMTAIQEWAQTALSAVGGAALSYLGLRRRYSKDSALISSDKAESSFMAKLMSERDTAMTQAREAWAQRTQDAMAIARFEALMEAGERETTRLRQDIAALRAHTRKLTAIIVKLDPQAAAMLQVDLDGYGVDDGVRS